MHYWIVLLGAYNWISEEDFWLKAPLSLVKVVALAKLFEKECAPPQKPKAWYATSKQYTSVSNL